MSASHWRTLTLGDVTSEWTERFGSPLGNCPVYGVDRSLGLTPTPKYVSDDLSRYKRLAPGMFAYNPMRLNIGSIGYCSTKHAQGVVSPDYVVFRCDRATLEPEYLNHYIQSAEWRGWTEGSGVGSVRVRIYYRELAQMPITIPPIAEQRAIAHTLGTLDDKIKLNHRMNETLEAMARALFKSWFVDFDPVRAKADGRDLGLPKPIADLFPARLVASELGEIPEGWEVHSIYAIADVVYGAPFASAQFNAEGIGSPLIRIRDLANESPGVWTPEVHPKGYKVRPGDIVVGMDGEFRAYLWGGVEAWLNQRVCVFQPKGSCSAAFVRNSIIEPLAQVEASETATTVIHLGKSDIDRFSVVVPVAPVLATFSQSCQPWYDRIVAAKREARTLAALRDTLLPKLISGELRVKDAERIVEIV